ncbi:MAG: zinc-dependent metalloprotease, partial [Mycobacteriaceae bacterium]
FAEPDGMLLLVAPNIIAVERALKVNPRHFRLWVCLHEVTHRVQFSSNPWLSQYMQETIAVLSESSTESTSEAVARLVAAIKDRKPPEDGGQGMLGVLQAVQSEPQRAAVNKLLMLGTLLEGHADHVMDAVGPAVVPTVEQIRTAFNKRRTNKKNPVQQILRTLLGMDVKMNQYIRGKKFVDAVVENVGMEQFNVIWSNSDTLPIAEEIEDPQRWISRVLG